MSDEELSRRYRRASESTAGAPGAATRAAIRREAEAQAAARRALDRGSGAANEPRWAMRAVAGIAAVAIAAGLWWQMRPRPVESVVAMTTAPAAPSADALATPPVEPPLPAPVAAPAGTSMASKSGRASAERVTGRVAQAAPPAPAAAEPPGDSIRDAIALRLPEAWSSDAPVAGLWVQLDGAGKVLAAGRGQPGLTAAAGAVSALAARAQRREAAADTVAEAKPSAAGNLAAGRSIELVNARGVRLQIAVVSAPPPDR